MSNLDCGCWTGPWWGINPPPKCDYHSGRSQRWPVDHGWTRTAAVTSTSTDATKFIPVNDLDKLYAALKKLIATTAIDAEGNPALHDAWQLALQALDPVRAAIERARQVAKDSTP